MLRVPSEVASASVSSSTSSLRLASLVSTGNSRNLIGRSKKRRRPQVLHVSYKEFVHFALEETKRRTVLTPSPLQDKYNTMTAMDGITKLEMLSFQAPKIRFLRSLNIENESMQVLDFTVFPRPEYDLPIFCANFFSSGSMNIIVLDLNPLHDVINDRDYKEKYYKCLVPLGIKYAELFPWGGQLTSESIQFFSPVVIWTKFKSSQQQCDNLYAAFTEYYKAWLELVEQGVAELDASKVIYNREAQHRYLTWRAEKDPGHGVLKRLVGEKAAEDVVRNFLFNGIKELGTRGFLDYFPEYRCPDGSVNEKRSVVGKSYENRPWNTRGEFTGLKC